MAERESRAMKDWEGVHSCHSECPCHTGGEPAPDFISPVGSLHSDRMEIRRLRDALGYGSWEAQATALRSETFRLRVALMEARSALTHPVEGAPVESAWAILNRALEEPGR